ncbi:MAG: plasmid recombination protein [Treponema sp.]|nr:plasmid recombination protein [Treponema sp.]
MASVDWMKMTVQKAGGLAKLHLSKDKREYGNHSNPDIDTSLSHNNYNIGCSDTPDMMRALKKRNDEVDKFYPPQKVRKDRVVACSLYCPCPKEISKLGSEEERKFFEGVHQIYENFFGKENVHGSFVHLDEIHEYTDKDGTSKESLAHAHTIVSAYTEWTEKDKKTGELIERKGINGKNFEKRDRYNKLNNQINDFCIKEWNIEFLNGGIAQKKKVEELKAENKLNSLKKSINSEKNNKEIIQQQIIDAKRQLKDVQNSIEELLGEKWNSRHRPHSILKELDRIQKMCSDISEQKNEYDKLSVKIQEQQNAYKSASEDLQKIESELDVLKSQTTKEAILQNINIPQRPKMIEIQSESKWKSENSNFKGTLLKSAEKMQHEAYLQYTNTVNEDNKKIKLLQNEWDEIYKPYQVAQELLEREKDIISIQQSIEEEIEQRAKELATIHEENAIIAFKNAEIEKNSAIKEKNEAIEERNKAVKELDTAIEIGYNKAKKEFDLKVSEIKSKLVQQANKLVQEKYQEVKKIEKAAIEEKNLAIQERDNALNKAKTAEERGYNRAKQEYETYIEAYEEYTDIKRADIEDERDDKLGYNTIGGMCR